MPICLTCRRSFPTSLGILAFALCNEWDALGEWRFVRSHVLTCNVVDIVGKGGDEDEENEDDNEGFGYAFRIVLDEEDSSWRDADFGEPFPGH